jgi:uncharacterized protein YecT (DUF1311 family)
MLSTTPARAKDNCRWNQDFAQNQKCFLLQIPCLGSYFGIERAPDYPKALKCFEANKAWPFVVLMYLNGQGTPRDVDKAEAVLKAGLKADRYAFDDGQAAILQKEIDRCKRSAGKSCPRIDFCQKLADATPDMDTCDAIYQIFAEARLGRTVAAVRSKLNIADRAIFERTVAEFKAYQLDEMQRASDGAMPGAWAGLYGTGQAAFARDNFRKLVREVVKAHQLKPATALAYKAADEEMRRLYRKDIRETVTGWQDDARDETSKESVAEDEGFIKDYKTSARESQLAWVKYRDSCAELASSLYRAHAASFDSTISIKTVLTEMRINELRYARFCDSPDCENDTLSTGSTVESLPGAAVQLREQQRLFLQR